MSKPKWIMSHWEKTRKIGKKRFQYNSKWNTIKHARLKAKAIRNAGLLARVEKHRYKWFVYQRKRGKR